MFSLASLPEIPGQSSALHLQWAQHSQCSQTSSFPNPPTSGLRRELFSSSSRENQRCGVPPVPLSRTLFPYMKSFPLFTLQHWAKDWISSCGSQGARHRWAPAEVEMMRLLQNPLIVLQEADCLGPTWWLPAQPWIKHFPYSCNSMNAHRCQFSINTVDWLC